MNEAKTQKFNPALISYEQIRDAKFCGSLHIGTFHSFEFSMQRYTANTTLLLKAQSQLHVSAFRQPSLAL
jgi:hypothetical protein